MLRKPQALKEEQRSPAPSSTMTQKRVTTTRVLVNYDVGFGNSLFIRGKGANLSWDKGMEMHNAKNDEWVWETNAPFSPGEFKVLINDTQYESGENHSLQSGATIRYTPLF